ncbi:MAG: hypothetical protein P8R42_13335 [Candidatus Binatia bacterium]|nr:hypothetical protein [Candidatus Binatia bacterium]
MEVTASAPGKVFLLGEYAVALGAPAVVATVDRRLSCRGSTAAGSGRLSIRVGAENYVGPLDADTLEGIPGSCRFVAAAVLTSARRLGMRGVDLEFTTWSDLDGAGPKVGLGGSAAAVVAATAATHALGGRPDEDRKILAALGVAAHRLAQGGGSGADVVASTLGGVQWISDLDASDVPSTVAACGTGARMRTEPLSLPGDLCLDVVATGTSASTGPRIRRFVGRARGEGPLGEGAAKILEAWSAGMSAVVTEFRDGCLAGSVERVLRATEHGRALLTRLGALTGIRIWTTALHRACDALGPTNAVAIKPSGAGGGDCAVALGPAGRRSELYAAWMSAGLQPLEVEASLDGVRVEMTREGNGHG